MGKKDLSVLVPEKQDAFSRILRFMTKADVTLTAVEEVILDRWVYCDVLLRSRVRSTDEIIEAIVAKWGVSKYTAINDVNATQKLFAKSRQISKKYLLHHHIEEIGLLIQKAGMKEKYMDLMPRLFDSYTKAIEALPDEEVADKQPPPQFIFNLAPGQQLGATLPVDEAMKQADEILMKENENGIFEPE